MLNLRFLPALLLVAALLMPVAGDAQSVNSQGSLANGGFSSDTNQNPAELGTLNAPGHPKIEAVDSSYDFRQVYNGAIVKHTFRVKNVGTAPLTISAVRTSCGCTAARPTRSQLLPGEESDIAVSFDTHTDHGPATRTITVISNDPAHQQLELTMRGDVKVQVAAKPSLVVFERVKRGTGQAQQVTLTDEMPDHSFRITTINNANPYVKVASQPLPGDEHGALLTITLLNTAPPGAVSDLVKVNTSRVPVEIPVSGTVLGDVNVTPPQVSFGIVPHHAGALRFVRLTNSGDHPVNITGISSNNTSVVAGVQPLKAGKEYKITVHLQPNTPDGVLRGMLAIKTDDPTQQDVQIPVYGIVGSFKG